MALIETLDGIRHAAGSDPGSAVFTALSDPVRRAIVERLALSGPMTVGRLSEPFPISAPAISRHLKVLENAGLVSRSVDRQWRVCSLKADALAGIRHWLETVVAGASGQGLRRG